MAIQPAIPLLPAQLDGGPNDLKRETRVAEFLADSEAFDLGEIGEIANAQAAGRLVTDVTYQMRRCEVVAVEFLFVRTLLLADINGTPQTGDPHEIFERARHRHGYGALAGAAAIGIVERNFARGALERVEMRSINRTDARAFLQAQRLVEAESIRRVWPSEEIDAAIKRRLHLAHEQGYACG